MPQSERFNRKMDHAEKWDLIQDKYDFGKVHDLRKERNQWIFLTWIYNYQQFKYNIVGWITCRVDGWVQGRAGSGRGLQR